MQSQTDMITTNIHLGFLWNLISCQSFFKRAN